MSFTGVANPRPPMANRRPAGVPGVNASGYTLTPKSHTKRIRVMEADGKTLIGYADLTTRDDRPISAEQACLRLVKLAEKHKRSIVAVPVYLAMSRRDSIYFEVEDPAKSCISTPLKKDEYTFTQDGKLYVLGQDNYLYLLTNNPSLQAPIKALLPFWEAERHARGEG